MYTEIYGNSNYSWYNSKVKDFLNKDILNRYKKLCEENKDNKIENNSVVYLSPLSTYPSYKFLNYVEENNLNIKKARSWDKIDTIVLDEEFFSELYSIEEITYCFITIENVKKCKDKFNIQSWNAQSWEDIVSDSSLIKKFFIRKDNLNKKSLLEIESEITGFPIYILHGNKKFYDNITFLKELFDNIKKYNVKVVLDSTLNKITNKDTVIDLDTFKTLYGMASSQDAGNLRLAREIISNCDYDLSRPYILFLANTFSAFMNKSDNKNYHSVHKKLCNEKSLGKGYTTHHKFIKSLIIENPDYKQTIADCLKEHLNKTYEIDLIKEIKAF